MTTLLPGLNSMADNNAFNPYVALGTAAMLCMMGALINCAKTLLASTI